MNLNRYTTGIVFSFTASLVRNLLCILGSSFSISTSKYKNNIGNCVLEI